MNNQSETFQPEDYDGPTDSIADAIEFMKRNNIKYAYKIKQEDTMQTLQNNTVTENTLLEAQPQQLNHEEFSFEIGKMVIDNKENLPSIIQEKLDHVKMTDHVFTLENVKVKLSVDYSDAAIESVLKLVERMTEAFFTANKPVESTIEEPCKN